MQDTVYKIHSNCRVVIGRSRSIIADLQRNQFHFIPNDLANLIVDNVLDFSKLKDTLDADNYSVLEEYIEYLLNLELAFECDKSLLENFIEFPMEWDFPATISNAVLDGETSLPYFNASIIEQLEFLGCNFIQLRFYSSVEVEELKRILLFINLSQIKSVDLIIGHVPQNANFLDEAHDLVRNNRKIRCLTIHSSDADEIIQNSTNDYGMIIKVKEKVSSASHCGNVHFSYFAVNVENFTESIIHNNCLNRKIAIDTKGFIKNCPSMAKDFGNIKDVTLLEAVNGPDFKALWYINKDKIVKCKGCEFRYICTDCRAYLDDPNDECSAPLKCGYNPSTCEWEKWSENPLKQKSIQFYGLQSR